MATSSASIVDPRLAAYIREDLSRFIPSLCLWAVWSQLRPVTLAALLIEVSQLSPFSSPIIPQEI